MAVAADRPAVSRPVADAAPRKTPLISFFGLFGALTLAFVFFIWAKWVLGPNFKAVPQGPSELPGWMDTVQTIWQPAGILATIAILWFVCIKPWRRDGRPTTDGVLVLAFCTLWFQDPLSAYNAHWFTYNTNLVNFGSWVSEIPGWNSYSQPGAMVPEPILIIGPVYVYFIIIATWIGCWFMRRLHERKPQMQGWQLVLAVFPLMCLVDVVGEAFIWLPLGFWEYPGGFGLLFPSTYHKYPINEMLTIGSLFTAMCALRYFKDDKGMTLVERGADKIKSPRRQTFMRIFAVTFAAHAIVFVFYNIPNSVVAQHSPEWPADLQKRSYLTNGLCGEGTPRPCPGPGIPHDRNRGEMLDPADYPAPVPFDLGKPGGAE